MLQDEIKKRSPFASPFQEAALSIIRTADRIQLAFERLFREHSITTAQYNVLRILRGESKPLPVLEIASRTITAVPGITGLVDRLEKAGLVQRTRCDRDRRIIYVAITPAGSEKLAKLDQPVLLLHRQQMSCMTAEELPVLTAMLAKLRRNL